METFLLGCILYFFKAVERPDRQFSMITKTTAAAGWRAVLRAGRVWGGALLRGCVLLSYSGLALLQVWTLSQGNSWLTLLQVWTLSQGNSWITLLQVWTLSKGNSWFALQYFHQYPKTNNKRFFLHITKFVTNIFVKKWKQNCWQKMENPDLNNLWDTRIRSQKGFFCQPWFGMVWLGMVWFGMVWYGMVWYGMVASWMVWCCYLVNHYSLCAGLQGGRHHLPARHLPEVGQISPPLKGQWHEIFDLSKKLYFWTDLKVFSIFFYFAKFCFGK